MSDIGTMLASIERRLSALEGRSSTSLRFGKVVSVEDGAVRVQLDDGDGVVTRPLRTLQNRVLRDQDIKLPDIGEPVSILTSGQGDEHGVCIGASYSGEVSGPGQDQCRDYHKYEDGTELYYDRSAGRLYASVQGDVEVVATKSVKVTASLNVELTSSSGINLTAPYINLAGTLTSTSEAGGTGEAIINGAMTIRNGGVSVPDSDVSAGAVSLRGHRHYDDGAGTPVGG